MEPITDRVACMMMVGNTFIVGTNSPKTSPKLKRTMPDGKDLYTTHAETHALQLAKRVGGRIRKVVVMRWDKFGRLTMARPCDSCMDRLIAAGLRARDIYFSDWEGKLQNMGDRG